MLITYFLLGIGAGLLVSALIITVYELTTYVIRKRVKEEVPEAAYVKIEKTYANKGQTTLPVYHAKAYNKSHQSVRDIEFNYTKSEYFYDGEKIML